MNSKASQANKRRKDGILFGSRKTGGIISTYSKKRPVQMVKGYHFFTPDTPEDWIPSEENCNKDLTGAISWTKPLGRCGSTLALRNISNIPLGKTLSRTPCRQRPPATSSLGPPLPNVLPTKKASKARNGNINKHSKEKANRFIEQVSKKSKEVTTYATKSMSTCSMFANGGSDPSVPSTIKSMSLCSSVFDGGISDQLQDDIDFSDESHILQPQNSTFIEDDCHLEFHDIFPQDLSAITEEPANKDQIESPQGSKAHSTISQLKETEMICQDLNVKGDAKDITPELSARKVSIVHR